MKNINYHQKNADKFFLVRSCFNAEKSEIRSVNFQKMPLMRFKNLIFIVICSYSTNTQERFYFPESKSGILLIQREIAVQYTNYLETNFLIKYFFQSTIIYYTTDIRKQHFFFTVIEFLFEMVLYWAVNTTTCC